MVFDCYEDSSECSAAHISTKPVVSIEISRTRHDARDVVSDQSFGKCVTLSEISRIFVIVSNSYFK